MKVTPTRVATGGAGALGFFAVLFGLRRRRRK
jgi:uncharacterized protein (TIGR03382 family)